MGGPGRVFHVPPCSPWRAAPLPAEALSSPGPTTKDPRAAKREKSHAYSLWVKNICWRPSLMNNEGIKGLQQPQQMCFMLSASLAHCDLLALGALGADRSSTPAGTAGRCCRGGMLTAPSTFHTPGCPSVGPAQPPSEGRRDLCTPSPSRLLQMLKLADHHQQNKAR